MANLIPRWSLSADPGWSGLDRLIDDLWQGFAVPARRAVRPPEFAPRLDVEETEDSIQISAELPGLEEKDFQVSLEGDVLSIHGERRDERKGFYHLESRRGAFRRALRLPFEPAADSVKAAYKNGVLTVTVPKPEEKSRVRAIPVVSA